MKFPTFRFLASCLILIALVVALAAGLAAVAATHGALAAGGLLLFTLSLGAPRISTVFGAATADYNAPERDGNVLSIPVAAATHLYAGPLVARDANGRAVAAADTAGLRVIGRSEEEVDNSAGAAGAVSILVKRGVFRYNNSATQAVTQAYLGQLVYVEDDTTVAISTTNKIVAGRVVAVETAGVWIDTRPAAIAAALVATSTNGTAGAAADLTALKAEAEKIGDDVRAVIAALNS